MRASLIFMAVMPKSMDVGSMMICGESQNLDHTVHAALFVMGTELQLRLLTFLIPGKCVLHAVRSHLHAAAWIAALLCWLRLVMRSRAKAF